MGYTGVRYQQSEMALCFCHTDNYMLDEAVCFFTGRFVELFLTYLCGGSDKVGLLVPHMR